LNIGIFVHISVQEMVYLKAVQKSPQWIFLRRENIDQKTYLIKFRGGFRPLSPPVDSPMRTVLLQVGGQPSEVVRA